MKRSAGILLYRRSEAGFQVLLVHPGGPYWTNKDIGAWSIPKGEFTPDEDPIEAAKREFQEELGQRLEGQFIQLEPVQQRAGKVVHAWAVEGDLDTDQIQSNEFELEWPPKTGRVERFPEVDRAEWFDLETAESKINQGQVGLIEQLERMVVSEQ
jgi:predicted NUDIX family NTP pyrophosphohydrolase